MGRGVVLFESMRTVFMVQRSSVETGVGSWVFVLKPEPKKGEPNGRRFNDRRMPKINSQRESALDVTRLLKSE